MAVSILGTGGQYSDPAPVSSAPADAISPYLVHLPGFDGPLALLLHLIERSQLEISTISLVAVTDQFVSYLRSWEEPPLPRLAEFVAMAARLLLIKSRSLLPRLGQPAEAGDDNDPLEDAEQLRRHLIEYRKAQEIAQALRARELAGLQSFARPTMLTDAETLIPRTAPEIVGVSVESLAAVFRRVLAGKLLSQPELLPPPLVTVAEKIAEVAEVLRAEGHSTLQAILERAGSRFEVVVMFLAVLELWHQARLIVTQEDLFGTIQIQPGPYF